MREPTPRFRTLQYGVAALCVLLAGCASTAGSNPAPAHDAVVRPGIDVLLSGDMAPLTGLRIGLITNHTGRTLDGRSTIDALYSDKRVKLVALFGPEHGLRGSADPGEKVGNETDSKTGLPIYSLYGKTNKPTPEMLANVDALVFDIQDVGTRYYTYPWTMILAMKAAAENNKVFVVLDRPNPIGGTLVQGDVNDTLTFVGLYHVPMRHGMTVGELATMINNEYGIHAKLTVIKTAGWKRNIWYDQTHMTWIAPSPNMPTLESATHYPGQCLFEGTNLSNARGTPEAFEQFGAPWLNNIELIKRLDSYHFKGVRFEAVDFTPVKPADGKYDGQLVHGVKLVTTDRATYDPTHVAIAILIETRKLHPNEFKFSNGFMRLVGNTTVRQQIEAGATLEQVVAPWSAQLARFNAVRAKYLLY